MVVAFSSMPCLYQNARHKQGSCRHILIGIDDAPICVAKGCGTFITRVLLAEDTQDSGNL